MHTEVFTVSANPHRSAALTIRRGRAGSLGGWLMALIVGLAFGSCSDMGKGDSADDGDSTDSKGGDGSEAGDGSGAVETADAGPPPLGLHSAPEGGFRILFLDVGQGDAVVLISDTGETMLIDGGRKQANLTARLHAAGIERVDAILATHADADHINGLTAALEGYEVARVYWNGAEKDTQVFSDFLAAAEDEGAEIVIARRGDAVKLGSLILEVLHPLALSGHSNNDSLVVRTGCPGAIVMFTGDVEIDGEAEMIAADQLGDIDVLKVSHHGAASASSQAFLDAVTAETAIISAGFENAYGHPAEVVMDQLNAAKTEIWKTDLGVGDDTVTMTTDCKGGYEVEYAY